MSQQAAAENKMGVVPVKKLLLTMSLPMMASMLVQAMYNIIDSIFVAQVSEEALTAVSLIFPIQTLIMAVGNGTGVGVNAILSRSLGAKNYDDANTAARNGLFLSLLSYLVFLILGLFFSRQFLIMQTSDPVIVEYGTQYMFTCTVFSFGIFFQMIFDRLLQSTGNTIYSMITQGVGAITNIILDPILIFGLFGFPRLEVRGAALATISGQILAMIVGCILNIKKNKELSLNMRGFRPSARIIKRIYAVGIPTTIMQSIGSLMVLLFNRILLMFSATAVSVFGVYFKLQSFIFMPVFGLNNGLIPIIAYNYGAKKPKRITEVIRFGIILAVSIMLLGFIAFQLFPDTFLMMFSASDEMLEIGVPALRTISYSFILAGFCIVCGSVFQALGNGVYSMVVSFLRQIIVLLPVAWFFAQNYGLDAVWYSFPIAELMSLAASSFFLFRIYRRKITPLYSPD